MTTWQNAIVGSVAICGSFTTICVAAGWLIKIIRGARKPSQDVNKKLDNDNKRLNELEEDMKEIRTILPMLLRSQYVILQHMRTNNSTGKIAEAEEEINNYLFNR